MKLFHLTFFSIVSFFACIDANSQGKDSAFALKAFRYGKSINPKTGESKDFILCGDDISTDSIGFFSMLSGCERNVHLLLGKYTYVNDTFRISPFDFKSEHPFLKIFKQKSSSAIQTIKFVAADKNSLAGYDSSWIVRCFKRRSETYLDFSTTGIVKVKREKYDGIELLQLTKIFEAPIVMLLDKRFDYIVVVNLPSPPLNRFITGASGLQGECFINKDSLFVPGSREGFKIIADSRKL